MEGGLELDDLRGPFHPQTFYNSKTSQTVWDQLVWHTFEAALERPLEGKMCFIAGMTDSTIQLDITGEKYCDSTGIN